MDTFTEQALKMILSPAVRDAFDLSKESEKTKDLYGRDSFGQSVLLARRLVEAGSRFVTSPAFPSMPGILTGTMTRIIGTNLFLCWTEHFRLADGSGGARFA